MRPLLRLVIAALGLGLITSLALAQSPKTARVYLPAITNGAAPTVVTTPNMVTILAVSLRAADDPAASQQVLLRNETAAPIYIGDWTVSNALRPEIKPYTFPAYELPAGRTIAVISGPGPGNQQAGIFAWGTAAPIWRTGDVAELTSAGGQRISWLVVPVLSEPPMPTAVPTSTAVPGPAVEIIDVVIKDPAFPNESDEYVQIRNVGDAPVNLAGWRLVNASRPSIPAYVFPSFNLGADVTIAVFTKVGEDEIDIGDFYWDRTGDIWRVADRAELRDDQNRVISTFPVPIQ